ncbi:nucleolar protein 56 isoform X1 [Canis lupus dingo]|uniref:nucleolar protein 56 isoform X1 n=1 Tax=Canis lupus dingo TaxID=286419 RepID=UPI0020C31999|nr:nucleolar protein 56 isoform X1 [Canis lupus dingo]
MHPKGKRRDTRSRGSPFTGSAHTRHRPRFRPREQRGPRAGSGDGGAPGWGGGPGPPDPRPPAPRKGERPPARLLLRELRHPDPREADPRGRGVLRRSAFPTRFAASRGRAQAARPRQPRGAAPRQKAEDARAPALALPPSGRHHRRGPLRSPAKVSSPASDWPAARGRGLRSPGPRARPRSPHCEPGRERAPWFSCTCCSSTRSATRCWRSRRWRRSACCCRRWRSACSTWASSTTSFASWPFVPSPRPRLPWKMPTLCPKVSRPPPGVVHEDLRLLLETHLPSKKKKVLLGVGDPKIGAAIQEELGYNCQTGGVIAEILRGVRLHFHNLVKGLTDLSACKAQLGLGHSYSRAKVKFNVNRVDNMIIQSISLLDQLDKDINTFSMRVREWYGYHFPELVKIINDNATYCRLAQFIGNRRELNEEKLEKLEELTMDGAKAKAILDASRSSMGMDISAIDLINIESFSSRVVSLSEYRQSLHTYLRSKMSQVAPSLSALIGEAVGARLIAHAGSLTNLAKYPASTVQILGAEKALFRALKTRGNTPKYGLIFHSTFIGRAAAKNKGRISRYLANKCSIASRIDCFSEVPTSVFGEKLREQVEERLSFYETGEIPRKNLDVMKEAMVQAEEAAAEMARKLEKQEKKRLKKEKKRLAALALASSENSSTPEEYEETQSERPKKKKKQKPQETPQENGMEDPSVSISKPKKKRSFSKEELVSSDVEETAGNVSLPKRKKSFPKEEPVSDAEEAVNRSVPKKKRKFSSKEEPLSSGPEEAAGNKSGSSKKKKKLQKLSQED